MIAALRIDDVGEPIEIIAVIIGTTRGDIALALLGVQADVPGGIVPNQLQVQNLSHGIHGNRQIPVQVHHTLVQIEIAVVGHHVTGAIVHRHLQSLLGRRVGGGHGHTAVHLLHHSLGLGGGQERFHGYVTLSPDHLTPHVQQCDGVKIQANALGVLDVLCGLPGHDRLGRNHGHQFICTAQLLDDSGLRNLRLNCFTGLDQCACHECRQHCAGHLHIHSIAPCFNLLSNCNRIVTHFKPLCNPFAPSF